MTIAPTLAAAGYNFSFLRSFEDEALLRALLPFLRRTLSMPPFT